MIKLRHIERCYPLGKQQFFYVLRDINLEVEEGDFVSVMGPSGAGKSTLLHMLGMHDFGWTGEYYLDETAVHRLKPKERTTLRNEQIGFVFQNYNLLDDLTVYENLDIPLSYRRYSKASAPRSSPTRSIAFRSSGKRIFIRASSPAGSNNWSASRARSSPNRSSSWPTSRPATCIQPGRGNHGAFQANSTPKARPSSRSRIRKPTPPTATASSNCATAGSSTATEEKSS